MMVNLCLRTVCSRAVPVILVCLLLLPAMLASSAPRQSTPSTQEADEPVNVTTTADGVFLVRGTQRLRLRHQGEVAPQQYSLGDTRTKRGTIVSWGADITVTRPGAIAETLSGKQIHEAMLTDATWGDHAGGNQARYMDTDGGGLGIYYSDPVIVGEDVLAVMNVIEVAQSAETLLGQFLFTVHTAPNVSFAIGRPLALCFGDFAKGSPRLFHVGSQLLLIDWEYPNGNTSAGTPSRLAVMLINAQGNILKKLAQLPANTVSSRLLDERWIVLFRRSYPINAPVDRPSIGTLELWVYDAWKKKTVHIPGVWRGWGMACQTPAEGGAVLVLLDMPEKQPGDSLTTVHGVTIPNGHDVTLPNPANIHRWMIWQGMAIVVDKDNLTVYDARNGRQRGNFTLPPATLAP